MPGRTDQAERRLRVSFKDAVHCRQCAAGPPLRSLPRITPYVRVARAELIRAFRDLAFRQVQIARIVNEFQILASHHTRPDLAALLPQPGIAQSCGHRFVAARLFRMTRTPVVFGAESIGGEDHA